MNEKELDKRKMLMKSIDCDACKPKCVTCITILKSPGYQSCTCFTCPSCGRRNTEIMLHTCGKEPKAPGLNGAIQLLLPHDTEAGNKKTLQKIMQLVFEEYRKNGYEKMWNEASENLQKFLNGKASPGNIADIAELGLIDSEVSEAMEAVRKGTREDLAFELADVAIRLFNYASRKGIDLEKYILEKHRINSGRGKLHGKRV